MCLQTLYSLLPGGYTSQRQDRRREYENYRAEQRERARLLQASRKVRNFHKENELAKKEKLEAKKRRARKRAVDEAKAKHRREWEMRQKAKELEKRNKNKSTERRA
ncbi:hypothetical protein G7Y79_00002g005530 [Physcia stellaris]|nr:hypothetical protein G7Y79_00002g005530 [Physcia stellaris]